MFKNISTHKALLSHIENSSFPSLENLKIIQRGKRTLKKMLLVISIFSLINSGIVLACGGNCLQCHPDLDINHKPHKIIKTCINCHKKGCGGEENKYVQKSIEKGIGCGANCFQCHEVNKIISLNKNHKILEQCIDCHKKLKD